MQFHRPHARIRVHPVDEGAVRRLGSELSIPRTLATLLVARGLTSPDTCQRFFNPGLEQLHDPFLFDHMGKSVDRILRAVEAEEQIAVYGDYDVDGITATAMLMRALRRLGANCRYYLPNRLTEGYGVSEEGIDALAAAGVTLIVSVDCGISAVNEVAKARGLGIDVIVTDHHEPKKDLPPAFALLNPRLPDCTYPDKSLAGVGVALKLVQALCCRANIESSLWKEDGIDLAALGTAADIVPLTGENRVIASLGFKHLPASRIAGIRALMEAQGLGGAVPSSHHVVFQLAPCINAVGRLGDPRRGAEMLLTDDARLAGEYARALVQANVERREINEQVQVEASAWVQEHSDPAQCCGLVAASPGWHVGVIGIVASRLVEQFSRPTVCFSIGDDGLAKGSGRTMRGVHLLQALTRCHDLLEAYGGHAAAAGMTIRVDKLDAFRERFSAAVREQIDIGELVPTVFADVEAGLADLSPKLFNAIRRMEPFGPGNMRPVFVCRGLTNAGSPRIVGNNHLKLSVRANGSVMDAIGFGLGDRLGEVAAAQSFSLAFSLDENEWNGRKSLQMRVKGVEV